MARIQGVQALVFKVLTDNPKTRSDDYLLILEVLKNYVTTELSLEAVLEQHVVLGVPSFASIVRARRKLQEKHPELVNKEMKVIREQLELEFRDYALNS